MAKEVLFRDARHIALVVRLLIKVILGVSRVHQVGGVVKVFTVLSL